MDSAIELFSTKGYAATGVDEIAEAVGLRGPNLYKYFKGKGALLDAIMAEADNLYSQRIEIARSYPVPETPEELKAFTLHQLTYILENERFRKMRKIVFAEQYRSQEFADRATKYQLTTVRKLYRDMFKAMIEQGIIREGNPCTLALEYYAPISLMVQLCDRQPEKVQYATEQIARHIDSFIAAYFPPKGT